MRRILALARVEVLHVVRDRASLTQILLMPMIQLLVLANAATFKIRDSPLYVVDFDHTPTSRGMVERFTASGNFHLAGASASPGLADEQLLRGTATLVLTIPDGFERGLVRTGSAPVNLTVNGEKGSAAGIVQSYATQILQSYAAELGPEIRPSAYALPVGGEAGTASQPPQRGAPRIEVRSRDRYNADLNYTHYMVPGILVALVTMIGTLLTAQNIAREKEAGTLEQLNVTPITRGEFIAAKMLPFWTLAMIDLSVGLLVGKLVFDIPMRGSIPLLFASAAVYLVVALGIGLWISTLVETQQQAMFVTFFFMMVYLLMSGLFTPIDSMPQWVQVVSEINPVRHFVTIARAILVKGAGLSEIARPLGILAVYGVVIFTLAVRQYRKRTA